jgi:hypothetical protein
LGSGGRFCSLRAQDATPYREAIVRGCVQDLDYDAQLESSRATYLFDIIEAAGDEALYVEPVAKGLRTTTVHWSTVQLSDLKVGEIW